MRRRLTVVAIVGVAVVSFWTESAFSDKQAQAFVSSKAGAGVAREKETEQVKNRAKATFKIESWDETPYNEIDGGPKLVHVKVVKSYHGEIEGKSTLEYLMMYRQDGTACFVGFERVVGRVGDRSGSFVLRHNGEFQGGTATVDLFIVAGSGTGELSKTSGKGGFAAGHADTHSLELDFDFE